MNLICRVFGHDDTRWFADGRVTTRCHRCKYESPGLAHDPNGPKPIPVTYRTKAEQEAERPRIWRVA